MEASSLVMTKGESPDEGYHPLSPLQFWKESDLRARGAVLTAWLLTLVVSIGLGIASISLKWSGIPMHFGGVDVSVTIYPTLILCMLWVVWFGFWWGFIPAYLSTLILALYSGMPIGWALVFAFSDPIGLAIFAVVYRALPVSLNLRSLNSSALFVFMSFVSGMFGSSGAFIWCLAQGSLSALLPIWQGWWLGAFLQNIVLVAPVIHLGTRRVMRWRNDHGLMGQNTTQTQRQILLMTIVALTGVLLYLYVAIRLVSKQIESALHGSDPISLRNAASLQVESMNEIFWIISILIAFIAFFGYQLFVLWVEHKQAEYELTLQNSGLEAMTAALERSLAEREKAEEEIHKLNEGLECKVRERTAQLEAANKELEAFSYSVSHDLRAPLRHIDGYVDLLVSGCRDGLTGKGLHYVDTIAASARQMGVLIDDLLQFSRTGRAEMRRETMDMNQALQEALTPLQESQAGRAIEWVIGQLPSVRGDVALLRQVWANLLENAVKYTRQREVARIEVSTREGNGEIIFAVSDNGVGFDMQYAGKLFGVFQRLHSQEEFEGTGIGLATVRRIIDRHGGRVWAEAVLNQGATFNFALPGKPGGEAG